MALLWVGWYGYKKGLTRHWREIVTREFRRRGIEVSFKKLTLDPFRGLVAREVTLFDAADRLRLVAEIDSAVLSVDLGRFVNGRPFLTALELRDAQLSLPMQLLNEGGKRLEIRNLRARIYFPDKQVQLASAEARVMGCRVSAQGWLANAGDWSFASEKSRKTWADAVQRLAREIQALGFKGDDARLQIQFSGDLADPAALTGNLQFSSDEIVWRGVAFDSAECFASWHDETLEIRKLVLEGPRNRLKGSGRWTPVREAFDFEIESILDLGVLLQMSEFASVAPFYPTGLTLLKNPTLQIHIQRPTEGPLRLTGQIRCGPLQRNAETFESLEAFGSWEEGRWSVREIVLRHSLGEVRADLLHNGEGFRGKMRSSLPPDVVLQAISRDPGIFQSGSRGSESAVIEVDIEGDEPRLGACKGRGSVQLGKCVIESVAVRGGQIPLLLENGELSIGPGRVDLEGGKVSGTVSMRVEDGACTFRKLRIEADPLTLMQGIRPNWRHELAPFRFEKPPVLTLEGSWGAGSGVKRMEVEIAGENSLRIQRPNGIVDLDEVTGSILIMEKGLRVEGIRASLWGGEAKVWGEIPFGSGDAGGLLEGVLQGGSAAQVGSFFLRTHGSVPGEVDAEFQWKGGANNVLRGNVSLRRGEALRLPLFEGLPQISPLLRREEASGHSSEEATGSFRLEGGILKMDGVAIKARRHQVSASGTVSLVSDKVDLQAHVSLGTEGGGALEFRADGPALRPVWRPKDPAGKRR